MSTIFESAAAPPVDSRSVGDPARFLGRGDLERLLAALPPAPRDRGTVSLLVRRGPGGVRELLEQALVTGAAGLPGDAWGRRTAPSTGSQLAVIQADVAEILANGQPLTLFGDNLFLDLDLSTDNLPVGSRVRAGGAELEVTPTPHNGCRKFHQRFGPDALRVVSDAASRHRNLRGIYMRVVQAGEIKTGGLVEVLERALGPAPTFRKELRRQVALVEGRPEGREALDFIEAQQEAGD